MARLVLLHGTGSADLLKIESVPTPVPANGEVRIRVKAIGLNRAEVNLRAGTYGQPFKFPAPIGLEAAGEIDAVGADVTDFKIGDGVSVIPGFDTSRYGTYADTVIVPAKFAVRHPPFLTWQEAAAIWMSFAAAWVALIDYARLAPGDPVLLNAASSSVGLSALQLIRREGGAPIALTRTPKKVQALKTAGATEVIVTEKDDLQQIVMKLTQNHGARVIFDAVGGSAFANLVGAAAGGGIILVYGVLSKEANSFSAIQVIRKNLLIRGVASTAALTDGAKRCAFKEYVLAGLQSRVFQPRIAKIFPFEEIVEAHKYIESGEQFGKVVLTL